MAKFYIKSMWIKDILRMSNEHEQPAFWANLFLNDCHLTAPSLHPDGRAVQLRGLPAGVEHPVERQVCRWVRLHLRYKEMVLSFSKKKFKGGLGSDLEFGHEKRV